MLGTGDDYIGNLTGVTVSDNADAEISTRLVVEGEVNTAVPGTYTITYNVTDETGNPAAEVTRTVTVTDDDAPVIEVDPMVIALGTGDDYIGNLTGVASSRHSPKTITQRRSIRSDSHPMGICKVAWVNP